MLRRSPRRPLLAALALALALAFAGRVRAAEWLPPPIELEPVELPRRPGPLFELVDVCAAERGEVWECAADAMTQYSQCIAFAVIDADTDAANRCAIESNIRIDCCRGVAAPGVICP